jgi:hypothetical protein
VHDVFHVSQLKKYLLVPKEQICVEDLDAKEDLSYHGVPIKILETSKREEELKADFPSFFSDLSQSQGRDSI